MQQSTALRKAAQQVGRVYKLGGQYRFVDGRQEQSYSAYWIARQARSYRIACRALELMGLDMDCCPEDYIRMPEDGTTAPQLLTAGVRRASQRRAA